MATEEEDPVEKTRMTLGQHLDELRVRLFRALVAMVVVFSVAWFFKETIGDWALAPLEDKAIPWLNQDLFEIEKARLYENGEPEAAEVRKVFFDGVIAEENMIDPIRNVRGDGASSGFFFYMKTCGYFSLFIAGPFMIWQVWAFVAAGLYRNEKKLVYRYFPFTVALFVSGVVFGYLYMVPYAQYYLVEMALRQVRFDPKLELYFTFLTSLSLGMGVVFQLPIVMLVLARVGLVEPKVFSKYRGHFWVGSLVIAAMLTPPDPYTQMMMAGPMALLYEVGLILSRIGWRKANASSLETPDEGAVP